MFVFVDDSTVASSESETFWFVSVKDFFLNLSAALKNAWHTKSSLNKMKKVKG